MDAETAGPRIPRKFEDRGRERYSGESVLAEYALLERSTPADARLVMIRFLAVQYFANRLRGDWPERLLRLQRSAAQNAIGTGLVLDPEQRLLRRALELDDPAGGWQDKVLALLSAAAAQAQERAHRAGAVALGRLAYEAALGERQWARAAENAARIAQVLPREDVEGRRRWRRRARTLERRGCRTPAVDGG